MSKSRVKSFLFRMLCGFFLGISVIAPGVSSSIMAVMMGIYRDLIDIISNPFKNFKRNFFYGLPLGIGAIISVALFVKVFAFLFENYPVQARLFFMGLIMGSIVEVFRQARENKFKRHYIIGIVVAFGIALTVGLFGRGEPVGYTDQVSVWYLCIAGFISGVASMVPGMSVSLILMLFGLYDYLLKVASGFTSDIMFTASVALPMGICFLVGMVLFSNVTKVIFERYPGLAYFMVFGFMCGTLIAIFPTVSPGSPIGWIACILTFIAGLSISAMFQFLGKKFNVEEETEAEDTKNVQTV